MMKSRKLNIEIEWYPDGQFNIVEFFPDVKDYLSGMAHPDSVSGALGDIKHSIKYLTGDNDIPFTTSWADEPAHKKSRKHKGRKAV